MRDGGRTTKRDEKVTLREKSEAIEKDEFIISGMVRLTISLGKTSFTEDVKADAYTMGSRIVKREQNETVV